MDRLWRVGFLFARGAHKASIKWETYDDRIIIANYVTEGYI